MFFLYRISSFNTWVDYAAVVEGSDHPLYGDSRGHVYSACIAYSLW